MGKLFSLIQEVSLEEYITEYALYSGEEDVQKIELLKDKNLLQMLTHLLPQDRGAYLRAWLSSEDSASEGMPLSAQLLEDKTELQLNF